MPVTDSFLSGMFLGATVDKDKFRAAGWICQGEPNFQFGFPKKKTIWLKRFEPADGGCCHRTIWIFVLVTLGRGGVIKAIDTATCEVHNDGSFREMGLPLIYPTTEVVGDEIKGLLSTDAQKVVASKTSGLGEVPLSVADLVEIIDKGTSQPVVKDLIKRFGLIHSPSIISAGELYNSRCGRFEFDADMLGVVKTIWVKKLGDGDDLFGLKKTATKEEVRAVLGPPTHSNDKMGWDRFDNLTRAIHVSYHENGFGMVTIMSPSAAP